MPSKISLSDHARPFLCYLDEWYENLPTVALADVVADTPQQVALFSIDMINGFCKEGPLAGERVGALIPSVVKLFERAYTLGVRAFVLAQDTHTPNTPEFQSYPPHCIAGTSESQVIVELQQLPFANEATTIEKNSLSITIGTNLEDWMQAHSDVNTFIVIGDCSDLCVYSAAMYLRLSANALNVERRVIVPADAVDTFDTPVSLARELRIKAHDGDLHHVLFLHHMAMNGIEVVGHLT